MQPSLRDYFDQQLERVLDQLPEEIHRLLDRVPLYVEDYPSRDVLRSMGIRDRRRLCGLYTGIPLTDRSIEHSGVHSDVVRLYREGILSLAALPDGGLDEAALREQIRITLLHELGHHFGMTEEDLADLGYG